MNNRTRANNKAIKLMVKRKYMENIFVIQLVTIFRRDYEI